VFLDFLRSLNKAVQAVSDAISSDIDTVGSTIESAVDSIGGKGQSGGNISGEKSKFEAAQSQPKSPSAGDGGMSGSSGGNTGGGVAGSQAQQAKTPGTQGGSIVSDLPMKPVDEGKWIMLDGKATFQPDMMPEVTAQGGGGSMLNTSQFGIYNFEGLMKSRPPDPFPPNARQEKFVRKIKRL
jgi:hypothetical protein